MRYVKVLILALFFFLCLVFLFQNQNVLSQKLTLELNLLAIPKMTSIELPFYFIILVSFLAGCVMALLLLLWDRMRLSAHILQQTWRISNLENENHKLVEDMGKLANADEDDRPGMFARIKAQYLKARQDRKIRITEKTSGGRLLPAAASQFFRRDGTCQTQTTRRTTPFLTDRKRIPLPQITASSPEVRPSMPKARFSTARTALRTRRT